MYGQLSHPGSSPDIWRTRLVGQRAAILRVNSWPSIPGRPTFDTTRSKHGSPSRSMANASYGSAATWTSWPSWVRTISSNCRSEATSSTTRIRGIGWVSRSECDRKGFAGKARGMRVASPARPQSPSAPPSPNGSVAALGRAAWKRKTGLNGLFLRTWEVRSGKRYGGRAKRGPFIV